MAQSAAIEPVRPRTMGPGVWGTAAVLACVFGLSLLDRFVLSILVPGIKQSFHASDTQVSLLNGAAFGFVNGASLLVCGPLADRFNRRNLLIIGVAAWSLATIAAGLAQSFGMLLAARMALGVFQAVAVPVVYSMMADRFPPEVKGRAVAVVICGATAGGALSSFIGGGLLQVFLAHPPPTLLFGLAMTPWQWVLVVCGLLSLCFTPVLLAVAEPPRQGSEGHARPWAMPYVLRNRAAFFPLIGACCCLLIASYALGSWMPVLLFRNLQMRPVDVGLTLGLVTLASAAATATLGGYLSDVFNRRDPSVGRIKLLSFLMLLAGVMSFLLLATHYAALVMLGMAAMATGGTIAGALAATFLPELTPNEERGQISAIYELVGIVVGMGVAPTLVALVTDKVLHDENGLPISLVVVLAPAYLAAAALAWYAVPRIKALQQPTSI
jgi:MFS family permease